MFPCCPKSQVENGRPEYSKIAREWAEECDLDASIDWLRQVVKTKWEQFSGIGARRRADREKLPPPPPVAVAVDPELLALHAAQAEIQATSVEEKNWQKALEDLWDNGRVPPVLKLKPETQSLKAIQDAFRLAMLKYWAENPQSLKYTKAVEPLTKGTLHAQNFCKIILFRRGHHLELLFWPPRRKGEGRHRGLFLCQGS